MTKTNALSRWTPGPKSTGAMLEHGGWDHKAMRTTRWGIDGETALRAWAKGKSSIDVACAAAACVDGEALRTWLDTEEGFDAVQEDLQGAAMREITAVPSFVIDDRFLIPGAQDVDVFVNVLERALTR